MKKSVLYTIITALAVVFTALIAVTVVFFAQLSDKNTNESPTEIAESEDKNITLLVYMVGSDLEAGSASGTDDLKELEESNIDINKANVVVYCGGSPKWHTDYITRENNSILELTPEGFKMAKTEEVKNMGEADALADFINYGYENYPAQSYALILWNHGNGPVIGYGKDMLFDEDSLTLAEMTDALEKTPFDEENKLEWVGFDACLMASAELNCTWAPYAKYLVSSQEVEPAFGWNYTVFESLGKADTESFLENVTEKYIETCVKYYEKKGYDVRDTTLSLVDLSYAKELKGAINALFEKAGEDVLTHYDALASKRVETRALGRASTGSEYDLVDLKDMATQLEKMYPEESEKVCKVLDKMIVANCTTAEGCWGMSIYYPFYNKYYYNKSWGETYENLGLFTSYGKYIDKYKDIWLNSDKLEVAKSQVPTENTRAGGLENGEITYTLSLTKEQNETFADARFYVLKRMSNDLYHPIMSSSSVEKGEDTLTAKFDSKAIYVRDSFGRSWIPNTIQHDAVGNKTRYTIPSISNFHNIAEDDPNRMNLNYHIELDNETETITVNALLPREEEKTRASLTGGKLEEVNEEDFVTMSFVYSDYIYLSRYDNNVVKPLEEWIEEDSGSWLPFAVKDDIQFEYAPLVNDQYYIIFEITDTQGNKYCSEPLETKVETGVEAPITPPEEINWSDGEKITIYDENGVEVYLKKDTAEYYDKSYNTLTAPSYTWEVVNNNSFPVTTGFGDIVINSAVTAHVGFYETLDANSKAEEEYTSIKLDGLCTLGALREIESIEGTFFARNNENRATICSDKRIKINISADAKIENLAEHYTPLEVTGTHLGALAEEQVLYQNEDVRIKLLFFGETNLTYTGFLCYENLSDKKIMVKISSIGVNSVTIDTVAEVEIYPHTKRYESLWISISRLNDNYIKEIGKLDLTFGVWSNRDVFLTEPDIIAETTVKLKKAGSMEREKGKGEVIFEEQGVKIILNDFGIDSVGNKIWDVTIANDTDEDIYVETDNDDAFLYADVKKNQQCREQIKGYNSDENSVSFHLRVFDVHQTKVLFTSESKITLKGKKIESDTPVNIEWSKGDKVKLLEHEGIALYLKNKNTDQSKLPDYQLEVENNSPYPVWVEGENLVVNSEISIADEWLSAKEGESYSSSMYTTLNEHALQGYLDEISSISFDVSIQNSNGNYYTLKNQRVTINLSGAALNKKLEDKASRPTKLYGIDEETQTMVTYELNYTYETVAKKQILWENDELKVTLLKLEKEDNGLGSDYSVYYKGYLCIENLSDKAITVEYTPVYANGAGFIEYVSKADLPEKTKYYTTIQLGEKELADKGVTEIKTLEIDLGLWYNSDHSEEAEDSKKAKIILE